jgi:hypothetical protein
MVDSWAEHQRQHDGFTVADLEIENRVLSYAMQPSRSGILFMPGTGFQRTIHRYGPPLTSVDDEKRVSRCLSKFVVQASLNEYLAST